MSGHTRRRSSIDPASIENILTSGASTQPSSPPTPNFTTSRNRMSTSSMDQTPLRSPPARPLSFTPRTRPNRLSLQFPVSTNFESARPTPTSSNNTTSFPPTPNTAAIPSPSDPNGGFLEALAGQERKVFELKEELEKAEHDLVLLKRKWAHHEAAKKRAEIRHAEPMQPLQAVVTGGDKPDDDAKSVRQSIEIDRRRLALNNTPREARRRVFTGHHTRALSLLSPERPTHALQTFPVVPETSVDSRAKDGSAIPRSTTLPDTTHALRRISANRMNRHSYQGTATHGVKQIAEDVKAGLWTFLEDLRQATVGDEAMVGTSRSFHLDGSSHSSLSRRGSKGSLLTSEKLGRGAHSKSPVRTQDSLTGSSPTSSEENNTKSQRTRSKSPVAVKKKSKSISVSNPSAIADLDDDWSNWDTPDSPRWSGTTLDDPLTPMNQSTIKSLETPPPSKKDEIPWPDLKTLTPSHLQRTVSTLMKEWEKSLTPPPEDHDPMSESHSQSQQHSKSQIASFSSIDACLM
ncbi:hypothetical protein BP6252_00283 [Coleophoma cylindrospora]|uniref:DUF4048 domain-containing protein n=1 Tax=Coleophoma cylindrospora TaxID=1849047 RepID=A0A3D8SQ06_9HELO|nr:hypothetical protein BP6252_00283 [Coleophoma cylindrospora]